MRKGIFVLGKEKFGLPESSVPSLVLTGKVLDTRNLPHFLQVENELVGMFCQGRTELGMPDRFRFPIDDIAGALVIALVLAAGRE